MKVITGTWQNTDGTPAAGARVFFDLSQDAVALGIAQIGPNVISFTLDNTGSLPANTRIWFNDELTPSGTIYTVSVILAGGGVIYGPENLSITGASPFNINNAQPTTQNVLLANPIVKNPTAAQTITGFDLNLTGGNFNVTSGNISITTGNFTISSGNIGITSGNIIAWNSDTSLSRTAAGVLALGNGTQGSKSGTLQLTAVQGPGLQFQAFTANGTFTIPTGITQVQVTVVGAGGAGGGSTAANNGTGGGSGGSTVKHLTGLTPGNTLAITVGTGGTGVSGATGNNGTGSTVASGTQTITSIVTNGGLGGNSIVNTSTAQGGSGGAVGTGGDTGFNNQGTSGFSSNTNSVSGAGGPSIFGGGGAATGSQPGNAGVTAGSGGSGSAAGGNGAGGAGANGIVIFEWIS